ncbi:MAG: hypothetical protein FJY97_02965 [candidate division Zixibacteria bacterium]|nr:hypothetical protein [candidate division Zixibacteria bacterium]
MDTAKRLKQRINAEQMTAGVLVTDHLWTGLVSLVKNAGLDYLIVDQEHGAFDDERVSETCVLGRQLDFPVLIRPIDFRYATLRRVVDRGPCGVLLPGVESPSDLDEVREAVYLPPRGRRRPGGAGCHWVNGFHYENWKQEFEDDFIVLPQIESRKGLAQVDAIAGHEMTTAIAVGPYDLSAELGVCWHPDHPVLQEAVTRIREAGRCVGKNMWHMGDGPQLVREGFTFLCVGEPSAILADAMGAITRSLENEA